MDNQNQTEQWKQIPGYDEYDVSSLGRVRSRKFGGERILRINTNYSKKGYRGIMLSKEGKVKMLQISRLLAQSFIPNPEGLPEVDHIDKDRTNDKLENLRWCTRSQNLLNTRKRSTNKSGIKGISRDKKSWCVRLTVNGKHYRKNFKEIGDAREYLRGLVDGLDIAEFYHNDAL